MTTPSPYTDKTDSHSLKFPALLLAERTDFPAFRLSLISIIDSRHHDASFEELQQAQIVVAGPQHTQILDTVETIVENYIYAAEVYVELRDFAKRFVGPVAVEDIPDGMMGYWTDLLTCLHKHKVITPPFIFGKTQSLPINSLQKNDSVGIQIADNIIVFTGNEEASIHLHSALLYQLWWAEAMFTAFKELYLVVEHLVSTDESVEWTDHMTRTLDDHSVVMENADVIYVRYCEDINKAIETFKQICLNIAT